MEVIIDETVYEMTRDQLNGVLDVAMKYVPFGIYAIEKDNICELKKDIFEDESELMVAVADYEEKGFKVYYNS